MVFMGKGKVTFADVTGSFLQVYFTNGEYETEDAEEIRLLTAYGFKQKTEAKRKDGRRKKADIHSETRVPVFEDISEVGRSEDTNGRKVD